MLPRQRQRNTRETGTRTVLRGGLWRIGKTPQPDRREHTSALGPSHAPPALNRWGGLHPEAEITDGGPADARCGQPARREQERGGPNQEPDAPEQKSGETRDKAYQQVPSGNRDETSSKSGENAGSCSQTTNAYRPPGKQAGRNRDIPPRRARGENVTRVGREPALQPFAKTINISSDLEARKSEWKAGE